MLVRTEGPKLEIDKFYMPAVGSLCVSEDTFLEVNDYRLLHNSSSSVLKCLVRRIFLHIVVPFRTRGKPEDESVANTILQPHVRSLHAYITRVSGTCRPSMDVSFPPVIDIMYGLRVFG